MEKMDLYTLIEAYLDDALPPDQRREVEQRIASDEAFREEVGLHRALQEDYSDPTRWRLRATLSDLMEEELPIDETTPSNPSGGLPKHWQWAGIVAAVLVAVMGVWYLAQIQSGQKAPEPVEKQTIQKPNVPIAEAEGTDSTIVKKGEEPPTQKPKEPALIAQADPANFKESPSMEALMGFRGGSGMTLQMSAPKHATTIQPNAKGAANLRFSGALKAAAPNETVQLDLLVFNNKAGNKPLLSLSVQPASDTNGNAAFDLRQQVGFPKGLYYFRIEERESGEVLVVGKFFIGSL